MIRAARDEDATAIARLVNEAFQVEAFFKIGDRTSPDEVLELMRHGEFLLAEAPDLRGCIYLKYNGDRAYFGMLSIVPGEQRQGHGRRLVAAAEQRAAAQGCRYMDLHIVDLREDLPGYYRRLGYTESGTLPFSDPSSASRPCYFIVMTKSLPGAPAESAG